MKNQTTRNAANHHEYARALEQTVSRNVGLRYFYHKLAEEMDSLDKINPYGHNPMQPSQDKSNAFLMRHAGLTYKEFVRKSKPEALAVEDYGQLEKSALKKKLFEYRAKLYLSALEESEKHGFDAYLILRMIKTRNIPPIKKNSQEPTYQSILNALGVNI